MGKSKLQVPDTGTRVLDNTRPFLCSSIVSFWITLACSKERKDHIFGQYWYTKKCSSIDQYWDIPVSGTWSFTFSAKCCLPCLGPRGGGAPTLGSNTGMYHLHDSLFPGHSGVVWHTGKVLACGAVGPWFQFQAGPGDFVGPILFCIRMAHYSSGKAGQFSARTLSFYQFS